MKKNIALQLSYFFTMFLTSEFAMADGFNTAGNLLKKVSSALTGLSLVTITVAAVWVGYKVLFGGSTLKECGPIIIGALIIASASEVGSMLAGSAS